MEILTQAEILVVRLGLLVLLVVSFGRFVVGELRK